MARSLTGIVIAIFYGCQARDERERLKHEADEAVRIAAVCTQAPSPHLSVSLTSNPPCMRAHTEHMYGHAHGQAAREVEDREAARVSDLERAVTAARSVAVVDALQGAATCTPTHDAHAHIYTHAHKQAQDVASCCSRCLH